MLAPGLNTTGCGSPCVRCVAVTRHMAGKGPYLALHCFRCLEQKMVLVSIFQCNNYFFLSNHKVCSREMLDITHTCTSYYGELHGQVLGVSVNSPEMPTHVHDTQAVHTWGALNFTVLPPLWSVSVPCHSCVGNTAELSLLVIILAPTLLST